MKPVHGEFLIMRPLVSKTIPDIGPATHNVLGLQGAGGLFQRFPLGFVEAGSDEADSHGANQAFAEGMGYRHARDGLHRVDSQNSQIRFPLVEPKHRVMIGALPLCCLFGTFLIVQK
jgi:hypothetical protein